MSLQKAWTGAFLAGILAVLAFLPSLQYPLLFDDALLAGSDPRINPAIQWGRLWNTPVWINQFPPSPVWRPLFHVSLALNKALFGQSSQSYHAVNVLLHALAAMLFYGAARSIGAGARAGAAAAILFALHPVHAEAAASIAGRAETLMSIGVFLTLSFGIRAAGGKGIGWLLAAAASYAFAIFSKEQGYLAIVLLAAALMARGRGMGKEGGEDRETRHRSLPPLPPLPPPWLLFALLFAVALAGLSGRAALFGWRQNFGLHNLDPLDNPLVEAGSGVRLGTALRLLVRAAGLTMWPTGLSPDYSAPGIALGWRPLAAAAGGLVLVMEFALCAIGMIRTWSQTPSAKDASEGAGMAPGSKKAALPSNGGELEIPASRLASLGFLWFFIAYLPASNLIVLNGTIFADRFLYLPSAGTCLAFGAVWGAVREYLHGRARSSDFLAGVLRSPIGGLLIAAGCFLLLGFCWKAQSPWKSEVDLFGRALSVVPQSSKAHYGIGLAFKEQDKLEAAKRHWTFAIQFWPRNAASWQALGILALENNSLAAAEDHLRESIRLDPHRGEAWNSLGNTFALQGRLKQAILCFERYRRLGARNPAELERKIEYTRKKIAVFGEAPPAS